MRGATRALEPRKCRLCRCDRPGARASQVGGASPSTSGGFCANPHSTRTAECEVARLSFSRWPVEREVQKIVIVCSDGAQGKRDNVFWDELGQVATVSTSAPRRMISKAVPALYESWGYEKDSRHRSSFLPGGLWRKRCHTQRWCVWVRSKPKSLRPRQGLTSKFEDSLKPRTLQLSERSRCRAFFRAQHSKTPSRLTRFQEQSGHVRTWNVAKS